MDLRVNIKERAKGMDKTTLLRILSHIEKHCFEIEEVEELLWNLLDEKLNEEDESKAEKPITTKTHIYGSRKGESRIVGFSKVDKD